jgi:hypothetical protein
MIKGYSKHKENKMVLLVNNFRGFQTDVFQNIGTSDTYLYVIAERGIHFNTFATGFA